MDEKNFWREEMKRKKPEKIWVPSEFKLFLEDGVRKDPSKTKMQIMRELVKNKGKGGKRNDFWERI